MSPQSILGNWGTVLNKPKYVSRVSKTQALNREGGYGLMNAWRPMSPITQEMFFEEMRQY